MSVLLAHNNTSFFGRYRPMIAAVVMFTTLACVWTVGSLRHGSAWTKTGSAYSVNSIIGYSETERTDIIHKENRSFLQQISLFAGATSDVVDKFYLVRPTYSFGAAFLAPLFGIKGGALAMNLLAWAAGALCAWHLSTRIFSDDRAGMIAVAFVATGMGFTSHVLDYSAHLLAFTTYYVGIVALYESVIWKSRQNWPTHLALGTLLAICCLTYNTGVSLVIAYLVLAFRHNRVIDIGLGVAIAMTAQFAWVANLNIGYALITGEWGWYNLYGNENDYLKASVGQWIANFDNDPLKALRQLFLILLEFLSFESPLTVIAGIFGLALLARRDWRLVLFFLVLAALPIAGAMLYAQRALARGYLVFGISLVIYVVLAGLIAGWTRSGDWRRWSAIGLTAILLTAQIAWSGAHFIGQLGPLRGYYIGIDNGIELLSHRPIDVVSLTGYEPRPAWYGGQAEFGQLGLNIVGGPEPTARSFTKQLAVSLGARGLLSFYMILLIACYCLIRRRPMMRALSYGFFFVYLLPSVAMALTVREIYRFGAVDNAGPAATCRTMTYSVALSDTIRRRLTALTPAEDGLALFFRPTDDSGSVDLSVGGRKVAVTRGMDDGVWSVDRNEWLTAIRQSGEVRLAFRSTSGVHYLGWQRDDLDGRKLAFDDCGNSGPHASALPAVELRILTAAGTPVFIGF